MQIPFHRLADSGHKRFLRQPAQLPADLACIDGIAPIMARPVGHISDLLLVELPVRMGLQLVKQTAQRMDNSDIRHFIVPT